MLEVPSGHRALTDAGAVDDLATSLAEGLAAQVAEVAKRVPGAGVVVQIDEPALPAVLTGSLPTASGFGMVPAVPTVRVIEVLSRLTDSLGDHPSIAHCCHAAAPLRLLRASGFDALSVDMTILGSTAAALDPVGEAVETGAILLAGLIPSTAPATPKAPLKTWADAAAADLGPAGLPAAAVGRRGGADTDLRARRRGQRVGAAGDDAQPGTGRRDPGPAGRLVGRSTAAEQAATTRCVAVGEAVRLPIVG